MGAAAVCEKVCVCAGRIAGEGASLLLHSLKTPSQWRYTISITLLLTSFSPPCEANRLRPLIYFSLPHSSLYSFTSSLIFPHVTMTDGGAVEPGVRHYYPDKWARARPGLGLHLGSIFHHLKSIKRGFLRPACVAPSSPTPFGFPAKRHPPNPATPPRLRHKH